MSVGAANPLTLTVNGTATAVALPATAAYNTVVEKDIPVSLNSGDNAVSFNVNKIAV